jgi:hypothetical protein
MNNILLDEAAGTTLRSIIRNWQEKIMLVFEGGYVVLEAQRGDEEGEVELDETGMDLDEARKEFGAKKLIEAGVSTVEEMKALRKQSEADERAHQEAVDLELFYALKTKLGK